MKSANIALTAALLAATPAFAEDGDRSVPPAIVVTGQQLSNTIDNPPATQVSVDAPTIAATVNAVSVEDALKYMPSLIVRKRSIGDNFAPIATRTSGLGSSARSLIYADGALLSALIGNNNGNASPKWQLITPEEVQRIDVLYGPFSAAYPGNSIGTVVNIATRMPDQLSADATVLFNNQWHSQYATHLSLPTGQGAVSLGDRIGRLSFLISASHTIANGQPIVYATATTAPNGTTGAIPTFNRTGMPIVVLGAGDIDHHVEDTIKLKLAYDLTDTVRVSYSGALFLDSTHTRLDTYLSDATGAPAYTGAFNSGLYLRQQRHWSHALSLDGNGGPLDWQVIGTLFDYDKDGQSSPKTTNSLPAAFGGGPGSIQQMDGTGWWTLDAKAALRSGVKDASGTYANVLSLGGHADRETLRSQTFDIADWQGGPLGARSAASFGDTRTAAIWAQDAWRFAQGLVLTLGARQEWWSAFGGFNQTSAPVPGIVQPERTKSGFSPKATLEWRPAPAWSVKASFGQAWRFPTVGELYQATTVGAVLANPNPDLEPERARSEELAVEHHDAHGSVRISLFNEIVTGALVSQTTTLSVTQPGGGVVTAPVAYVQNVDRTRARGIELVVDRHDVLPRVDLTGSVTYADAITSADVAFPTAVGKQIPGVPSWKADAVLTWRPVERLSLTAAGRYSSRIWGTLDHSDIYPDTYQGFDRFFVVDLRALYRASNHLEAAVGIDNVNDDRYFLFHPFGQRAVTASLHWKL
jgi:iron complex outermembrane receptor protein